MSRCTSWRYTSVPGHQLHKPGACRECWRPCRQKVQRGVTRCHDCIISLISCPDTKVRKALLNEAGLDESTLSLLTGDPHPVIAASARTRLDELQAHLGG